MVHLSLNEADLLLVLRYSLYKKKGLYFGYRNNDIIIADLKEDHIGYDMVMSSSLKNRNINFKNSFEESYFGSIFLKILNDNIDFKNRKKIEIIKNKNIRDIIDKSLNKSLCKNCVNYKNLIVLKNYHNYNSCCDYFKKELGKILLLLKEDLDFFFLKEYHFVDDCLDMSYFKHESLARILFKNNKFHHYWCLNNKKDINEVSIEREDIIFHFGVEIDEEKLKLFRKELESSINDKIKVKFNIGDEEIYLEHDRLDYFKILNGMKQNPKYKTKEIELEIKRIFSEDIFYKNHILLINEIKEYIYIDKNIKIMDDYLDREVFLKKTVLIKNKKNKKIDRSRIRSVGEIKINKIKKKIDTLTNNLYDDNLDFCFNEKGYQIINLKLKLLLEKKEKIVFYVKSLNVPLIDRIQLINYVEYRFNYYIDDLMTILTDIKEFHFKEEKI